MAYGMIFAVQVHQSGVQLENERELRSEQVAVIASLRSELLETKNLAEQAAQV